MDELEINVEKEKLIITNDDVIIIDISNYLKDILIIEKARELAYRLYNRQNDNINDRINKIQYGIIAENILGNKFPYAQILGCSINNSLACDLIINDITIDVKSSIEKSFKGSDKDYVKFALNNRNFTLPLEQNAVEKEFLFQIMFYNEKAFLFGFKDIESLKKEENLIDLIVNKSNQTIQKTYMAKLKTGISINSFEKEFI